MRLCGLSSLINLFSSNPQNREECAHSVKIRRLAETKQYYAECQENFRSRKCLQEPSHFSQQSKQQQQRTIVPA